MDDAMLQRFAAESHITRIIHLYCHALDRRRREPMEQVFQHDARYGFGDIGGDEDAWLPVVARLLGRTG